MKYRFHLLLSLFFLGAIILFSNPVSVFGQGKSTLRVLITSRSEGTPVIGAHVILRDITDADTVGEISKAGVSDKDGFVELRDIEPDRYQLSVSFVGYKEVREKIRLERNQTLLRQIELAEDIEQLEGVIVKGERETTGNAGVRNITSRDLGRVPSAGPTGDLTSYLQTLPGVVTAGDRGGNLYIRGGTPEQNKILIDNLPVVKPFHISNLFSAFPEGNIQNIEMFAGGFGAQYLGATSAIVDATLKTGNMRQRENDVSIGSNLVSLQMEGPIDKGEESFFISGRKSLMNSTSPYLSSDQNNIEFYDATARYSYQSDEFYCNITAMHTFDNGQINPKRSLELSWTNTVFGGRCRGFDERYNHPFTVTAGYSRFRNTETSPEREERSSTVSRVVLKVDLEEQFWNLPVDYGFGLRFRTVSANMAEKFVQVSSFHNMNLIPYTYLNTEIKPNDNLTIKPSVGAQFTWGASASLEPRIRMAYSPGKKNNSEISLAAGSYTQDINGITDQRDAGTTFTFWKPVEGDNPIQKAYHGILSYRQNITKYLTTNTEVYVKDHRNISVAKWTPQASINTETAFANGFAYGADFRIKYDRDPIYIYVGYGWSRIKYEAVSENLGAWVEEPIFEYFPPHDQRHKVNTVMGYKWSKFNFNVSWEFGSSKPYTRVYGFDLSLRSPNDNPLQDPGTARTLFSRPYGERFPTYHRLDFSVDRTFQLSATNVLQAKVGCINIYNRDNIFYFDLNSLDRVNQTPLLPYFSLTMKWK